MEDLGKGAQRIRIQIRCWGYLSFEGPEREYLRLGHYQSALLAVLWGHSWAVVTND